MEVQKQIKENASEVNDFLKVNFSQPTKDVTLQSNKDIILCLSYYL